MVVIMVVAAMLFDRGVTDDPRFAYMGLALEPFTRQALASVGIDDEIEPGPVTVREERMREGHEREPRD